MPFKKQKTKPLERNHYKLNQRAYKASFYRARMLKISNLTVTASVPKQQSIVLTKSASVRQLITNLIDKRVTSQNLQQKRNKVQTWTAWRIMQKVPMAISKCKQIKIYLTVSWRRKNICLCLTVKQMEQFIYKDGLKRTGGISIILSNSKSIYKCNICHEAWPLLVKIKEETAYVYSRCVRDKNATKKVFS